jgi:ATP-binding cassette, subfamily B, bacterial
MLPRFLFRNLKGYRLLVVMAIIMTVLEVGSDILATLPFKFVPDKLYHRDPNIPLLGGFLAFFDRFGTRTGLWHGEVHTQLGVILFGATMLIFFSIMSAILTYLLLRLASYVAQQLTARLRTQLFDHLQRLTLDWHGKQQKGDLVQRITGNIADIEKLVTDGLIDLLAGILTFLGILGVMLWVSLQFTAISVVVVLPGLIVIVFGYTKRIKAATKRASKAAGQVANVATEDLGAITLLKAFNLEGREKGRFVRYVHANREAALRAGVLQAQFTPLVTVLTAVGTALILGVGAYVAADHPLSLWVLTIPASSNITLGTLFLFLSFLKMLYQPVRDISKLANLGSSAAAGAERIQEILDQAPEVLEHAAPYYGPRKLKGDIIFEQVTFGYTPDCLILNGINLHIPAGRKVALVGLSGGGKTTLVKLIPRFYDITQGSVKIDNVDHRMYPLSVLRQNVSMVLQDSVLFEGTIYENIEIGRPGAFMAEIVEAAKKAHIHETILTLSDGYETQVREQGKNFSGGQRQRLAIARAVLRDAPILILDEPTASLDVEAEAEVMRALETLVDNKTVLLISHRLSTLGKVDEIIVLKDGRIAERGTYQDLKRKGGVFAALLKEQNRYHVEDTGHSLIASKFAQNGADPGQRPVASPQPPMAGGPQQQLAPPDKPLPSSGQLIPPGKNDERYGGQVRQERWENFPHHVPASLPGRVLIEVDGSIVGECQLTSNRPLLRVGRISGNDIQVPSRHVSRLHARLRWENETWLIEDADSLNGLIYHGNRIDRLVLTDRDSIHLAPRVLLHYRTTL